MRQQLFTIYCTVLLVMTACNHNPKVPQAATPSSKPAAEKPVSQPVQEPYHAVYDSLSFYDIRIDKRHHLYTDRQHFKDKTNDYRLKLLDKNSFMNGYAAMPFVPIEDDVIYHYFMGWYIGYTQKSTDPGKVYIERVSTESDSPYRVELKVKGKWVSLKGKDYNYCAKLFPLSHQTAEHYKGDLYHNGFYIKLLKGDEHTYLRLLFEKQHLSQIALITKENVDF